MTQRGYLPFFAIALLLLSCNSDDSGIKHSKTFDHFPSASAIEYVNNRYYVMGDDSRNLLILDSSFSITDSINLYTSGEKRIPKPIKADIESITLTKDNKLLLLGSGSLLPYRSGGWLIDPVTKRADSIRLDTIYNRLAIMGLNVLNIEGLCSIPGFIVLVNRGNKAWRRNDLVLLDPAFWQQQGDAAISIIRLGTNTDSTLFNGVSGLDYAPKTDRLLVTVSTEDTRSNTGDGAIGKSYLWIINDISSKKRWKAINPNRVIDLAVLDPRFAGQKIESVCVVSETKDTLLLALAADNDDGKSGVFLVEVGRD